MKGTGRLGAVALMVVLVAGMLAGCSSSPKADVVVVGAGGAGLAAAIEAADAGASVIVLEKMPFVGGNTRICGGLVPGVGTELQKAAGIEDSPEKYAEDILTANGYSGDVELVKVATEEAAEFVPWFESLGAEFLKVLPFPGNSVERLHLEKSLSGAGLVDVLENAVKERNVEVMLETTATGLVKNSDGAITGVKATTRDGKEITIGAKAVVLAAGGFAGNKEMLEEYIPVMKDAGLLGHSGNVGDGIRMGIEAGADVRYMDAYCPHAAVNPEKTMLISWEMIMRGGILVNENGERFVDETLGYAKCAPILAQQSNGKAFLVFDDNVVAQVEKAATYEAVTKNAESVEVLAETIGVDLTSLNDAITAYNEGVAAGKDSFGRTYFEKPSRGIFTLSR